LIDEIIGNLQQQRQENLIVEVG